MDDEATAALMKAFHTHLKDGMGKAQALAAAQSDLRRDEAHPQWAHPFYWAAFVLTGDPGAVSSSTPADGIPSWILAVAVGGLGALLVGGSAQPGGCDGNSKAGLGGEPCDEPGVLPAGSTRRVNQPKKILDDPRQQHQQRQRGMRGGRDWLTRSQLNR